MKTHILIQVFLALIFNELKSQIHLREVLRIRDTLHIDRFKPSGELFPFKTIKMTPGDHRITDQKTTDFLATQQIAAVDLVYSDYPVGENFTELNRMRFLELAKFLPSAFQDKHIKWRVVLQNGVQETGNLQSYFHGFVVYYRPYDLTTELYGIESAVAGVYKYADSTLFRVFERHPTWTNMLVTMDVTGSMNPYTSQLIIWLKLNTNDGKVKHFSFFNDGNQKVCSTKQIGKTGGIYHIVGENYKNVAEEIQKAMRAGSGGDIQENDLEAILSGMDSCKTCKEIVLIADNFSPCRDLSLLKKINKPVKVILCGVQSTINTEYLQIAYETGGSVHTMESDIDNLMKLKEGQTIEIDGHNYKIQKGKFVKTT